MYLPPAFTLVEPAQVLERLRSIAFGHLVTAVDGVLDATAVPFVVDDEVATVRAHLARANRHSRSLDGADALLIVAGPDAYVSPRWYPSKADDPRVVPTWNYELIHLRGTVRLVDPEQTSDIVEALTDHHEAATSAATPAATSASAARDGEPPWAVSDAPTEFIQRQLRAIVGIELRVERIEAKHKLSQNRPDADRRAVAEALARSPWPEAMATAALMTPEPPQRPPTGDGPG